MMPRLIGFIEADVRGGGAAHHWVCEYSWCRSTSDRHVTRVVCCTSPPESASLLTVFQRTKPPWTLVTLDNVGN